MILRILTSVAASAALALGLSACGTAGLFAPPPGASPAVTNAMAQAKADADAALVKAIANKIDHCGLTGSMSMGVGGLAATGTGFANTLQLNCPGQAYGPNDTPSSPPIIPLSQLGSGGSFGGAGATGTAAPSPSK